MDEKAVIIQTVVLVATLGVIVWYTVETRNMAAATRDMAAASQVQRYDELRPLLVPDSGPAFRDEFEHPSWLSINDMNDQGSSTQRIAIRNVGVGPALNVVSVLGGCDAYVASNTGSPKWGRAKYRWMGHLQKPLAPSEKAECVHIMGRDRQLDKWGGRYRLCTPQEPSLAQIMGEQMPVHAARITITYHDVFGRKHASVFDYVQRWRDSSKVYDDLRSNGGWELVEFHSVTSDLNDLIGSSFTLQVEADIRPDSFQPASVSSASSRERSSDGLL